MLMEQDLAIRGGAFLQSKDPTWSALLRGVSGTIILVYIYFLSLSIFYFNFNWRFRYYFKLFII